MARKYFGTDGMRGQVGHEPITPERVLKLGWAAGKVLSQHVEGRGKVLIGKDTRISGYLLESALESGFSAAGVDVRLLGPMPTPGIAYLTRTARATAGVVISASHNPYEDNGIKFFSGQGTKLPDDVELQIEAMMDQPMETVPSQQLGNAKRYPDATGRYVEFCKSTFPGRASLAGLRIVLDCANGAAYQVAPYVFNELGADVIVIGNKPDGFNINKACGSTHPEALQEAVKQYRADVGVALDGDADRVLIVDENGQLVDGDELLFIIAMFRKAAGILNGGVVGTLMSNYGLEQAFQREAIPFYRAAVGDRYVMSALDEKGWELGGESSGHIICLDKTTTGDGIIAALEVLSIMLERRKPMSTLASDMEILPQNMVNVRIPREVHAARTFDVNSSGAVQEAVRSAETELAGSGRILLRASGTEPVIRVMVEGNDAALITRLSQELAGVVEQAAAALGQ
ncbi:MAG: phosphoglucosamine mutase [Gammaproteobacteria bacterium]|nr:phosphoglucosamine mutase [Gammaproteobacteria bacterium]